MLLERSRVQVFGITRNKWWAGTGLTRRHQDFQSSVRVLPTHRHPSSSSPSQQLSSPCRRPFDRSRLLASDSSGQVPAKSAAPSAIEVVQAAWILYPVRVGKCVES